MVNSRVEAGHNRSIVEIKARRIQFLNKRLIGSENGTMKEDEVNSVIEDESSYQEDTFDKFLTDEESNLIKDSGNENEERN